MKLKDIATIATQFDGVEALFVSRAAFDEIVREINPTLQITYSAERPENFMEIQVGGKTIGVSTEPVTPLNARIV